MFYPLLKTALFRMEAERAHEATLNTLRRPLIARLTRVFKQPVLDKPREVMGLTFPNAVGLAAGLDKNASCIDGLSALGFGFLEVGTVTPRAQTGNPKPRLFRLPAAEALINRMGFNNAGVEALVANLKERRWPGIVGVNIGKNRDTPVGQAIDDYLFCLRAVYRYASYVTINISSPNTPGLRELQYGEALEALLTAVKASQKQLADVHGRYVPVAVKIAPDLEHDDVSRLAETFLRHQVDAVIATNTTASRAGVEGLQHADETGGLSGGPLTQAALRLTAELAADLDGAIPIIAVGGILGPEDARARIEAGAALVQLYTGLIYRGPGLVSQIARELSLG
jgi:dihydroorotate dehydrogenase